jgi:hypothetical protein
VGYAKDEIASNFGALDPRSKILAMTVTVSTQWPRVLGLGVWDANPALQNSGNDTQNQ